MQIKYLLIRKRYILNLQGTDERKESAHDIFVPVLYP